MAAARNHHVMVLISHVEGNNWLVHDGNSGGGLTREHVISINGYVIVNPRGAYRRQFHYGQFRPELAARRGTGKTLPRFRAHMKRNRATLTGGPAL